mgnify:CR=1 FL=1
MSDENNPLPKNVLSGAQSIFLHEINWSEAESLLDLGVAYYSDTPNYPNKVIKLYFIFLRL